MGHYVYKYVVKDEPIYIGKNDTNLKDRIESHKKEEKFKQYLDEANIYYIELRNKAESSGLEKLLINKYKPILNVTDKYETNSDISFDEPEWHLFTFRPKQTYNYYVETANSDDVPIWRKTNLTIEETAAYSGIGINKIRDLTSSNDCSFVLWNGSKRLIKRRLFDEYIEKQFSI